MRIKVTNCCYMRGGSKVPFRIRKFQNVHWRISQELWDNYTEKAILDYLHGKMTTTNGYPVWITSTSRIIVLK